MSIQWAEPPAAWVAARRRRDNNIYKMLATRPGQYAIIGTYAKRSSADVRLSNIKRGKIKAAVEAGRFDGFVFKNENGLYDLYLRMMPA